MKVLFVFSGNSPSFEIAPFIYKQSEHIEDCGVAVNYFPVLGKGLIGYIKAAIKLRKFLRKQSFDIIHAHYTLSGWTAVLGSGHTPVVLSLMGTDAYGEYIAPKKIKFSSRYLIVFTYLIQPFVNRIIAKSENIEKFIWQKKKSEIIPNGVDLQSFYPEHNNHKKELGLDKNKKYILFLGNKNNVRKNYKLIENALQLLKVNDVELINPYPIQHHLVQKYLNSVSILAVTSLAEGSPNVVKEAMACNCPVVSTHVGDVEWLFGNEPGHFLTSFDPEDIADNIQAAINYTKTNERTNGRKRIVELGLDSKTVAKKIITVYKEILEKDAK